MTPAPNAPTPRDVIEGVVTVQTTDRVLLALERAGFAVVPVGLLTEAADLLEDNNNAGAGAEGEAGT